MLIDTLRTKIWEAIRTEPIPKKADGVNRGLAYGHGDIDVLRESQTILLGLNSGLGVLGPECCSCVVEAS